MVVFGSQVANPSSRSSVVVLMFVGGFDFSFSIQHI